VAHDPTLQQHCQSWKNVEKSKILLVGTNMCTFFVQRIILDRLTQHIEAKSTGDPMDGNVLPSSFSTWIDILLQVGISNCRNISQ
jgi:hypothetical protein